VGAVTEAIGFLPSRVAGDCSGRRWQAEQLAVADEAQLADLRLQFRTMTGYEDCPRCGLPMGEGEPAWRELVSPDAWEPPCFHPWHQVADGVIWSARHGGNPDGSTAVFSPDHRYRYELATRWAPVGLTAGWLMLNPSVADGVREDATFRRCRSFSQSWGFAGMVIWNLNAMVSTDPAALRSAPDPVGPSNPSYWRRAAAAPLLVCAWGANADPALARQVGVQLSMGGAHRCVFGWTANGHQPRHPLRLHGATPIQPWGLVPEWSR
jgi:hypothetical protein